MDLVLDEMDLNALVSERVDIDALAAGIDIDAIINRIDLIALADKVIEGVDLPAIIRESTNSMTAEVMTDVRTQGERADDVVAGFVDRMLGREPGKPVTAPEPAAEAERPRRDYHPQIGRNLGPAGRPGDHECALRRLGVGEADLFADGLQPCRR